MVKVARDQAQHDHQDGQRSSHLNAIEMPHAALRQAGAGYQICIDKLLTESGTAASRVSVNASATLKLEP